ncbi:hypothetical protein [Cohaesibacter haloalkalitolerans]|uniref:hypothetical protein n=1 Tax=Cohaesibacter haloalkalitolerans TaxID=1162980 RepID=UPI0013C5309A|nr:hypothetical protein [Cohaesibacter haloalkalitolerans]
MANVRVALKIKYPWWWRLYMAGAMFFEATIGGIDPDVAANFIARHTKFELEEIKGGHDAGGQA